MNKISGFILYMNSVKAIQPNNIYRVNPVNLFENRKQNSNLFNNSEYNLNHPKVFGSETQARTLDFLA